MCGSSCHWDILLTDALNCVSGDEENRGEAGKDIGQSTEQSEHRQLSVQSLTREQPVAPPQTATTARSKITDLHSDLNNPPHAGTLEYIQMGQRHTKQSRAESKGCLKGTMQDRLKPSLPQILNIYNI